MSEVLVRARPGPALWRVTRGASELVILGVVSPTPLNAAWNSRPFAQALQGARVLMLSPASTPGFAWADYFPESERFRLSQPFGRTLAKELGSDAMNRLDRIALAIRKSPTRYDSYRPAPAGMILLEDSWAARGFSGSQVDDMAIGLAKAAHVRVMKVDEGGALPLIDAMPSMSEGQHAACFREAMDQFDQEGSNVNAVFQAWADGNLAALRNLYRPLSLCMKTIPGGVNRRDGARKVWVKALRQALEIPGRAIVIMDVADLQEPSDLLAALSADGATVIAPLGGASLLPGLTLATAGSLLNTEGVIGVAKPMPTNLQIASPEIPSIAYSRNGGEAGRGAMVDLAGDHVSCISEESVGSIIAQEICHTSSQWDEIKRQRAEGVRQFYINRHMNSKYENSPNSF